MALLRTFNFMFNKVSRARWSQVSHVAQWDHQDLSPFILYSTIINMVIFIFLMV